MNFTEYDGEIKISGSLDIHKAILKIAPKKGFVLPGHNFTGPGNPLEKQVKWDQNGNILDIYHKPTGKTGAVAMQHDVDYSICKDVKCKNIADKKMVQSLAIPYSQRQWGHALARNTIATKAKLGVGMKNPRRKKLEGLLSENDWTQQLANELHKPIRRNFVNRGLLLITLMKYGQQI